LPPPIEPEQVIAENPQRIFLTMINPSPEKGATVFARLAEEISRQRPDLPILVIESRGTAGWLGSVARGFVLPLPESLSPQDKLPVEADVVRPWLELIIRCA
jgi:hypothetical protein